MKTSFSFLTVLVFASVTSSFAQINPLDSFIYLRNQGETYSLPKTIKINYEANVGSNSINTQMFSDFLFRSSFTPEAKQTFLDGNKKKTNLYAHRIASLDYQIDSTYGIYLKHKSLSGLSLDKNMSELLFFGNASFQNQKVGTKNLRYVSSENITAGMSMSVVNSNFNSKLSIGVSLLNNYRQITASELSLFTADGGDYIDAEVDNLAISQNKDKVEGIGLDFNYEIKYHLNNKNSVTLRVLDLNIHRLFEKSFVYLDTSLKFNGISYSFINDSVGFSNQLDSTYTDIVERGTEVKKWAILPNRVYLNWHRKLSEKATVILGIQAIDFSQYGVSMDVGLNYQISPKIRTFSSLGYGNFSGLIWRESAEIKATNKLSIYLSVLGLNALIAPKASKNYGINFGLAKKL